MHIEDFYLGGIYMTMLLTGRNIKKDFTEKRILIDINFDIAEGERIGLVGLNGTGKTTLVNILTENILADEGSIIWHKKSVNIGYLKQETAYTQSICCDESTEDLLGVSSTLGLEKINSWNEEKLNNLSGGERTKLALSQIWASNPDFLIFDEPTNHLDYHGVQWLIKEIKKYKGTVIVVSHDRYFLDECVNKIWEIDEGILHEYNGNYSFYRNEKQRRYESQFNQYLIQEETKRKINNQIKTLRNWSAKAHKDAPGKAAAAGNKKGGKEFLRAKAKKMDIQIKSRIKRLEKIRIEGVEKPKEDKKIDLRLKNGVLKGNRVIEACNISKRYEDKILFERSSFYIQRGERLGIFGENGCGKTTLLKILLDQEYVDNGEVFLSTSSVIGYLSQDITDIDNEKTVFQLFDISSREQRGKLQSVLFNMGFSECMLEQPVKTLSLGEITRLRLTKLIIENCDLLILDEPLNHLDIHSREKLEEVLRDYKGTIVVVAHDRYMLEKICDKLLVFENKHVKRVEYGLKEYIKSRSISDSKNMREELMLIDNRIACILGELSKCSKDTLRYEELDLKYKELINIRKSLSL
jgi:macrolide transport system ATP-binding/permease protein